MSDRSHGRKAFLNGEDQIAYAGVYSIEGDNHITHGLVLQIERLEQQYLFTLMGFLLLSGDNVPDNPSDNHNSLSIVSMMATTDASVGTS